MTWGRAFGDSRVVLENVIYSQQTAHVMKQEVTEAPYLKEGAIFALTPLNAPHP